MDKDTIEGTVKAAAGDVERTVGAGRGDTAAEIKGAARQLGGAAERVAGQANDALRDLADRPSFAPLLAAFAGGLILGLFLNRR